MKFRNALALVALVPMFNGCGVLSELLGDGEKICLDELLEYAGLTRKDLEESGADKLLEDTITSAESVVGELPIRDCVAEDKSKGLVAEAVPADPVPPSEPELPEAAREGQVVTADSPEEIPDAVDQVMQDGPGEGAEVMILVDTTGSMWDDLQAIVDNLEAIKESVRQKNGTMGIAWYGDNMGCDDPWYGRNPSGLLSPDDPEIDTFANDAVINGLSGGCDWPESMYDGIWETASQTNWSGPDRTIIVITDAEALEGDKTNHSKEEMFALLDEKKIALDIIMTAVTF